jgi:hypothetical protein
MGLGVADGLATVVINVELATVMGVSVVGGVGLGVESDIDVEMPMIELDDEMGIEVDIGIDIDVEMIECDGDMMIELDDDGTGGSGEKHCGAPSTVWH